MSSFDPDFTVTVGGQDVTDHCMSWTLNDVEEGMSTLRVTIANPDLKFSGKFKTESQVSIRFGRKDKGQSPKVTMTIKDKSEDYPTGVPTISVTGYDCTEKMTGTNHSGNSKKDAKIEDILKAPIEGAGLSAKVEGVAGPEKLPEHWSVHNMSAYQVARHAMSHTKAKSDSGGAQSSAPIFGQKATSLGKTFPKADSVAGHSAGDSPIDKQLADMGDTQINSVNRRAASVSITGKLALVGVPQLQAKKCVSIQGVGPEASGKWYCRSVEHSWSANGGYRTSCSLLRGGVGKNAGGKDWQPVVMYAEIYEKNQVYVGPRKIDGDSQATFTYGQGQEVTHFSWSINTQNNRSGGEKGKRRGLYINKAKEVADEETKMSYSGGGASA